VSVPYKRRVSKERGEHQITNRAVDLFDQLRRARSEESWWELHHALSEELNCWPWEFPCVEDPKAPLHSSLQPDLEARALWERLAEASRDRRRAQRQVRPNGGTPEQLQPG
jgi:hypothetical protein